MNILYYLIKQNDLIIKKKKVNFWGSKTWGFIKTWISVYIKTNTNDFLVCAFYKEEVEDCWIYILNHLIYRLQSQINKNNI